MTLRWRGGVWVAGIVCMLACRADLSLPDGALVACEGDDDCPSGNACVDGACVDPSGNKPPVARLELTAQGANRALSEVGFTLTLSDFDGDAVNVALSYSVDGGSTWHPASVDDALEDLAAPPSGSTYARTWLALEDASGEGHTVTAETWRIAVDPEVGVSGIAGEPSVRLRVVPTDAAGEEGDAVQSPIFSLGNTPPGVTPVPPPSAEQTGLVLLTFEISDTNDDTANIEVQFQTDAGPWRDALIAFGALEDLVTTSGGSRTYQVLWQSDADAHLDPTTPQGTGAFNGTTLVRLRAADSVGGELFYSDWSPTVSVNLHNDNLPPALTLTASPSGTAGGDVSVDFILADVESSPSSLQVEFFNGLGWLPAAAALSTPTIGLATSPVGVAHTFTWTSTQLGFDVYAGVKLRLTPVDSEAGVTVETPAFTVDNRQQVNVRPTVLINAVRALTQGEVAGPGRPVDALEIELTVADPNGDGDTSDLVALSLAVKDSVGGSYVAQHYDGTAFVAPSGAASSMTGLSASSGGTTHVVRWEATTALLTTNLDVNGAPTPTLVGNDDVWLELVATDDASSPLPSAPFEMQIAVGNDAPETTLLAPTAPIAGAFPIELELTDSQQDVADIQLQFRVSSDDTWRAAQIALGTTTGLITAPQSGGAPRRYVVVWQSDAPSNDADPSAPQGAGDVESDTIELRIRAGDQPGPNGFTYWGAWHGLASLPLDNQSPPRLTNLLPRRLESLGGRGLVDVHFRLFDPDFDVVDVLLEYSTDGGATWQACTEHPSERSGGRLHLQTTDDDGGGIDHVFVWDATIDPAVAPTSLRIRATPADPYAVGAPVEIPLVNAPWLSDVGQLQIHQGDYLNNGVFTHSQIHDMNSDSNWDLVHMVGEDCSTNLSGPADELRVRTGGPTGSTLNYDPLPGLDDPCANPTRGNHAHITRLAVGDLNEDGARDLVMSYSWDVGAPTLDVAVSLGGNDGAGNWDQTFAPYVSYSGGTECRDTDIGDLDGDSVLDIVASCDDGVYLWWGVPDLVDPTKGDGTFTGPTQLDMATTVRNSVLADVNGDGALDIVSAASDATGGGVAVRINDGAGGFDPQIVYAIQTDTWGLDTADFNHDGLADIAVTHQGPSQVSVLLGMPSGALYHTTTFTTGEDGNMQPRAVHIADMDQDGLLDLVVGMWRRATTLRNINIHLGTASSHAAGGYGFQQPIPVGDDRGNVDNVVLYDFNDDGLLDTLTDHHDNNSSYRTDRTFGTAAVRSEPVLADLETVTTGSSDVGLVFDWISRVSLGHGDLNRDGIADLVVANADATIFGGTGLSTFADGGFAPLGAKANFSSNPNMVFPADFDRDGIFDLVGIGGAPLTILYGNDDGGGFWDGTFGSEMQPVAYDPPNIAFAVAGHLNADDFPDVVAHEQCNLRVYESTTDAGGAFTGYVNATVNLGVGRQVVLADLDNDGLDDLVGVGLGDVDNCASPASELRVRFNDPSGPLTYHPVFTIDASSSYSGAVAGDFNGDGILDLVGARSGAQALVFWPSNGDGTFGASTVTDVGVSDFLTAADFDADGILDVATLDLVYTSVAHVGGSGVPIAINLLRGVPTGSGATKVGSGAFVLTDNLVMPTDLVHGMWPLDVNGDGIPDLTTQRRSSQNYHAIVSADLAIPWVRPALYSALPLAGPAYLVGADLATADVVDNFGDGVVPALVFRVATLEEDMLYRPSATALSPTYVVAGDRRITTVLVDEGGYTDRRARVEQRYGDRANPSDPRDYDRTGLDDAQGLAFVFEIPLIGAYTGSIGSGTVVVLRRSTQWRTADTYPLDPLYGLPNANRYLPCRVDAQGSCSEHLRQPVELEDTLTETTDPTFGTASGDRFYVDLSDASSPVVRVWATKLGRFRVFVE